MISILLKYLAKPKYWTTILFLVFAKLIAVLPFSAQLTLGKVAGKTMFKLAKRRRKIALTNIQLCFPDKSEKQQLELVKQNFIHIGFGLVEIVVCWFGDFGARYGHNKLNGTEHLDDALLLNKGALLLGFHMTSIEICGTLLGQYFPISLMYKPSKNPLLDEAMCFRRKQYDILGVKPDDIRGLIKALKKNRSVFYYTDQNNESKKTVFAPFFGIQTSCITATSKLAKLTGAPVIPFTHSRSHDGKNFEMTLHPALTNFPSGCEIEDATQINTVLENHIKQYPHDYLWIHRRFRTRPPGEEAIY
jgi:KDO2-lipid IV(A) lauroyltransferase